MRTILPLLALFVLTACDRDRPPTPDSAQNAKLDEAEDMLDQMDNEEGAAPGGTAPSNSSGVAGAE